MTKIISKDHQVLLVDDDPSVTASIAMLLKQNGFRVLLASCQDEAIKHLENHSISLVIQDMNFSRNTSGKEGMILLNQIKNGFPAIPVILMTAWGSIELAVDGIKQGAADFITKPWDNQQLLRIVNTCLELNQSKVWELNTRQMLDEKYDFSGIVAEDPAMLAVLTTIGRVAATDAAVLILGESGTGKELIADAIHINSRRFKQQFVKVNLGGMNATLFESEMFGHVRGAFTDAKQDRKGRFELAHNGSIFLDEIGDLDPSSQVKLLRILQEQTYQAVGSSQTKKANVRVISATNCDLYEMVKDSSFREDLLYRINLITVVVPPLRNRRGDIAPLARLHLHKVSQLYNIDGISLDDSAISWLEQQTWPGNVRQLTQTVERAALMSNDPILSIHDFHTQNNAANVEFDESSLPIGSLTLDEMEKLMVKKAIKAYNNNLSKVAEALGISRSALYRRIEKHDLSS
jgi:two-component system NtrC family response regulator